MPQRHHLLDDVCSPPRTPSRALESDIRDIGDELHAKLSFLHAMDEDRYDDAFQILSNRPLEDPETDDLVYRAMCGLSQRLSSSPKQTESSSPLAECFHVPIPSAPSQDEMNTIVRDAMLEYHSQQPQGPAIALLVNVLFERIFVGTHRALLLPRLDLMSLYRRSRST